ncbi:MAG TPA: PIN domain-containing protein, partial [Spirochaetota bacterium]|nr:PIN domain-containing protein [Spirochaetota bacterium]
MFSNGKKIFVLDTNVVLHDYRCIYSFQEHNVVIPITLLEEMDRFKRGSEIINFNAREFSRELDSLIGDRLLSEGIKLDSGGHLVVNTNIRKDEYLRGVFWEDSPDHRILSVAYNTAREFGMERVILVSKDINLRMKAKSIGVLAEDYETGKIENIDELYTGKYMMEGMDGQFIDRLYKENAVPLGELERELAPHPNQFFIMRNGTRSALTTYVKATESLRIVEKKRAYGILPRNAEQTFSLDALMNPDISLVTLS